MVIALIASLSLLAPPAQSAQIPDFVRGKRLAEFTLTVGGTSHTTDIVSNGVRPFILTVQGTLSSPDGRKADAFFLAQDPHGLPQFPLPRLSRFLAYLPKGDNVYRAIPLYEESRRPPVFQSTGSYEALILPLQNQTLGFAIPATKWTSPREDILSGSLKIEIYEAIPVPANQGPPVEAIDLYDALRPNTAPTVPLRYPFAKGIGAEEAKTLAESKSPIRLNGVAADGSALVLLRSQFSRPGRATFGLRGQGRLYLADDDAFADTGVMALTVPTRMIPKPGGGVSHVAFVLYRPPNFFGNGTKREALEFKCDFVPDDKSGSKSSTLQLGLVRPPIVLVHGTYDNPKACWELKKETFISGTAATARQALGLAFPSEIVEWPFSMTEYLERQGFENVTCVDWEETNGSKDPSDFETNQKAVYENPGGIRDALLMMREQGIAVNQADLICHSQGGVIARVYAKGQPIDQIRPESDPHYTSPRNCRNCWYHTPETYQMGSIHTLLTLSSTHKGSEICRLFDAYMKFKDSEWSLVSIWTSIFLGYVHYAEQGIYTGGFRDQTPGCDRLRAIGATPIPAHALADVSSDEDMRSRGGLYYGRLQKIWKFTAKETLQEAMKRMGQPEDAVLLGNMKDEDANLGSGPDAEARRFEFLKALRAAAFGHDQNDCTVAMKSSHGGLSGAFVSTIEGVLHGYAPRELSVQQRVVGILLAGEAPYSPNGFPDAYSGFVASWQMADAAKGKRAPFRSSSSAPIGSDPKAMPRSSPTKPAAGPAAPSVPGSAGTSASLESLRLMAEASPEDPAALTAYAAALVRSGRFADGEAFARSAVRLAKEDSAPRVVLAHALSKQNRFDKAEAQYRECLLLDYRNSSIHASLASCLASQKKWAPAERSYKEAVRLSPKNGAWRAERALCLYRLNRVPEAKAEAKEAKRLGIKSHPVFGPLGLNK